MKIPLQEKIGYGLGDTASNFVWAMMMSFLMYFYTDVFGITAAAAGLILLFARVGDGVADFLMGALADRTRTRWGRFRPYLLWMCVPLGLTFVLSFTTPDFSIQNKLIYAWVTHCLLMLLYTAINIPYSALSGVMTDDPHERTSLNSYRMGLAQVGGIIVNFSTLPLVAFIAGGATATATQENGQVAAIAVKEGGGGYVEPPKVDINDATIGLGATAHAILKDGVVTSIEVDERGSGYTGPIVKVGLPVAGAAKGFQITVLIFAGIAIVLFLVTFATTRERIQPLQVQKTGLLEDLSMLLRNRHWIVMFVTGVTQLAFIFVRIPSIMYYFKYYVLMDAWGISVFLTCGSIFVIIGATSTWLLVRVVGKKYAFMLTMAGTGVFAIPFYWIQPGQIWLLYVFWFFGQVSAGMNSTLYWSMIADTADYSEWKFKVRTTGIVFSATTCSQKIGMGVGGWVAGMILTYYGYVANQIQTPEATKGILLMFSFIPAAGFLFLAAIFGFYGLTEKVCDTMREDLNQRRREVETSGPPGLQQHPGDVL